MAKAMKKKPFFMYSEEEMKQAILKVRNENMGVREAARLFGIPHSTLLNKLKEKTPAHRTMGPKTVISKTDEEALVTFILASARKGFPLSKRRLLMFGSELTGRKMGEKWFRLFLKRHASISKRCAEGINQGRAAVTEDSIRRWHANLKKYIEDEYGSTEDLLKDPSRIINSDESGFMINPKNGLVLGPRGDPNLYEVKLGSEKEQITTMLTISADGYIFPPLVVLPYERVPGKVVDAYNPDWVFGNSKSGWMTSDVFAGYLENAFLPNLKERGVKFPVLYLLDGHKSHLCHRVAKFCNENDIIIYSFRPNATHILQPADVSAFQSLKHHWKEEVEDFKSKNRFEPITKANFGSVLEMALLKVTPSTITNGFKKCGLYPFDADSIDYEKCMEHPSRSTEVNLKPAQMGYAHLLNIESCMQVGRAEEFRKTNEERKGWEGDPTAQELYKVWFKIRTVIEKKEKNYTNSIPIQEFETPLGLSNHVLTISDTNRPCQDMLGRGNITEEPAMLSEADEFVQSYEDSFEPSTSPAGEIRPESSEPRTTRPTGEIPDSETPSESRTPTGEFLDSETPSEPRTPTGETRPEPSENTAGPSSSLTDVSPSFYSKMVWPNDTPPKKKARIARKAGLPQDSGVRKWLQYYEDKRKTEMEAEAARQIRLEERKQRKEEKEKENATKIAKKIQKKDQKKMHQLEEDSEGTVDENLYDELENLGDTSGGEWGVEELSRSELEPYDVLDLENASPNSSDWVIVIYLQEKKNPIYYTGQIVNVEPELKRALVNFLKRKRGMSYVFPTVKDEDLVDISRIKKILPPPVIRRGTHTFPCNFSPHLRLV